MTRFDTSWLARLSWSLGLVWVGWGASGCALSSKAEPLEVSYLRPEPVPLGAAGEGAPLRLGEVRSGEALGRGVLTVREGGILKHEDELQWTEIPAIYLGQALGRTLFEAGPGQVPAFRRDLGPNTPRLEVELLRFEWLRAEEGGGPLFVECRVTLWSGDRTLFERTLRSEGRAEGPEELGSGFGAALADLAQQVRRALP